jgi:2-oxoglutarate dehydrogenase E1 component
LNRPLFSPAINNAEYIDAMYEVYLQNPDSLSAEWQTFFQGFQLATCPRTCVAATQARDQSRVASLIYAYRNQGHLIANIDPLGNNLQKHPALALENFELSEKDLVRVFDTGHLSGPQRAPLGDIIATLKQIYCRSIGVEYIHIQDMQIRRWLQAEMEPILNKPQFSTQKKLHILSKLIDAEAFEKFIHSRYPGQKRFSLEGSESLIPALDAIAEYASALGVSEIVMGMAHRGRLNVLANFLQKPYVMVFSEFESNFIPDSFCGSGDVKYHRGFHSRRTNIDGSNINISLTSNPSHLEAVNTVVLGRARAKQRRLQDTVHRKKVLPLLIHGDSAFAGQGLVAETLNLSGLQGYTTGGTIHIIVNNQIGFTTMPNESRSTSYSTDVAKIIDAPIFHVNGNDPEAVVYVAELALRYRQEFGRDVIIDMLCYRRYGHNESDEPAFTQPLLYNKIKNLASVSQIYAQSLLAEGVLENNISEKLTQQIQERLQQAFTQVKNKIVHDDSMIFHGIWTGLDNPYSHTAVKTGVSHLTLNDLTLALTTIPDGFALNPKIARRLPQVRQDIEQRATVDWPTAELLAFGSLLHEGVPVRLSGQDSARGTFSQRHAVWQDMNTQETYIPLRHVHPEQARFCVYNSSLSEAGVLGFDYGYTLDEPYMLVLWEAQFGDFANGAQVIIDQFIVSSYSKWHRASGIVMLLPHGYEGQGPEHSNAYLERYLSACAEDNIQVCNLSTPAQYFHALRRQIKRDFRRPLIIMAPKSMLRHPQAVSPVEHLISDHFHEILDDPNPPQSPKRLVLCSGKLYYDLIARRERDQIDDVAIVRLEQFYPYPQQQLDDIAQKYAPIETLVWAQEEPQNRGGWCFVSQRVSLNFPQHQLQYAGRPASASPATGSLRKHQIEQEQVVREALGQTTSHTP